MSDSAAGVERRPVHKRKSGAELSAAEISAVQLRVLDDFCRACADHQIRFYAYYGTLLGALRHKGYIPWDDDIDLAVPRKDYDRLAAIDWAKYDLVFQSADVRCDYPYVNAKIADPKTQWSEEGDYVLNDLGVNVDVFPLDDVPRNAARAFLEQATLAFLTTLRDLKAIKVNQQRRAVKNFALRFAKVLLAPVPIGCLSKGINSCAASARLSAAHVGSRVGPYGRREIHRRELFDGVAEVEFEGRRLPAPSGYHEILTGIYGDYMTPPPPEMRITHHAFRAYWRT